MQLLYNIAVGRAFQRIRLVIYEQVIQELYILDQRLLVSSGFCPNQAKFAPDFAKTSESQSVQQGPVWDLHLTKSDLRTVADQARE